MSKYTTEVRFICEHESGLDISTGYSNVNTVIANSYNNIFDNSWEIYDEDYREILCSKILKHYYMNEICAETVGLWKLWLNERMNMIMPYYNQLYKSCLYDFEPFQDIDYYDEYAGEGTSNKEGKDIVDTDTTNVNSMSNTSNKDINSNSEANSNTTKTGKSETETNIEDIAYKLYSDTPQGALDGLESGTYLTNATKQTDNQNSESETDTNTEDETNYNDNYASNEGTTTNENSENIGTTDTTINKTENTDSTTNYLKHVYGKYNSSKSYAEMLLELRKTFLNIDQMIINELQDLFILLW